MKIKILIMSIAILLFSLIFSGCVEQPIESKTIYVDSKGGKDYTSIQAAINAANAGDTIQVYSGIYNENLVINKSIILIGENNDDTIIIGDGDNDIIYLGMGKTTVSSFMLVGEWGVKGINVYSSLNTISDNNITKCFWGIYLNNAPKNTITDNIFAINNEGIEMINSDKCIIKDNMFYSNSTYNSSANNYGVIMTACNQTTIINNNILNIYRGIQIFSSSSLSLSGNIINNCKNTGLHLADSSENNKIYSNNIYLNGFGLVIINSDYNTIYNNNFFNNTYANAQEYAYFPNDLFTSVLLNNSWDFNSKGNYWDDYKGLDIDRNSIGDTPYNISVARSSQKEWNQDRFPLMSPAEI